jgi:hypothetical protein
VELLLDNLRNAFFKGKHGKTRDVALPDKHLLVQVVATLSVALLAGRAAFAYSIEPVAIALITVLLMRSKANIYTLPFILIGMLSVRGTSYAYLGDLAAFFVCAVLFLLPVIRKFPLALRALAASAVMVSVKVLYYLWAGLLFLYDGMTMAVDLLILLAFIYVFWLFFHVLSKGIGAGRNSLETVMVFSIIVLLSVGGLAVMQISSVSVLHVMAFLIALAIGYGMGPAEGGLVGIICGFLIMLMTYDTPALAGILGSCGAISGLFRGKHRLVVGICYVGLALAFGMLKGFPELYISIYIRMVQFRKMTISCVDNILPSIVMYLKHPVIINEFTHCHNLQPPTLTPITGTVIAIPHSSPYSTPYQSRYPCPYLSPYPNPYPKSNRIIAIHARDRDWITSLQSSPETDAIFSISQSSLDYLLYSPTGSGLLVAI